MISSELKLNLRNKYIENKCWGEETFGKMLERIADDYNDKIALKDEFMSITYSEWNDNVNKLAYYFEDKGLKHGDKVVIQLPNSVMFFIISFAMFKLGVVPVFSLPAHREKEITAFINKTNAKAYIPTKKHLGFSYQEMVEKCLENKDCSIYYEDDFYGLLETLDNKENYVNSSISSYDTAVLLVSGGTTGIPKLIPRTHADYLYDADVFAKKVFMDENTIFLASIPVAHNFAFANPGVIGTALNSGISVMSRNGAADEVLDLIEDEGVTLTCMVPSLLAVVSEMASYDDVERFDTLKTVLVGGSVLHKDVLFAAEEYLDCKVRQVFGTAEGLNTITPVDMDSKDVSDCQGECISEYDEIVIVDENDETLEVNESGEMLIRGPYTIMNYYDNIEADKLAFREDGFYRTGDKAYLDEKGYVHVCGRIREQINKSGEKINPSDLEEIIKLNENIYDNSVIAIPDKNVINKICACIVTDKKDMTILELREFMEGHGLTTYKLPDYILVVDSIPLTAVGKPDKKKLLEIFNERHKKNV